jgi:hypothetical protein
VKKKSDEAIRVSKESRLPFRVSGVDLTISDVIGGGAIGYGVGSHFGHGALGAIAGGLSSFIKIGTGSSLRGRETLLPYQFVSSLHSRPL